MKHPVQAQETMPLDYRIFCRLQGKIQPGRGGIMWIFLMILHVIVGCGI